jgi:hypothetical protein
MPRRTYEHQTDGIERADDIDDLVRDKRAGWRANAAKGRRRQRRYQNRMTAALRRRTSDWYGLVSDTQSQESDGQASSSSPRRMSTRT